MNNIPASAPVAEDDFLSDNQDFGYRFGDLALILFVIAAIGVLGRLLPPDPLSIAWQSPFVETVPQWALLPIIGLILLFQACTLNPVSRSLRRRKDKFSRWSVCIALSLLLLIPVQLNVNLAEWR